MYFILVIQRKTRLVLSGFGFFFENSLRQYGDGTLIPARPRHA